MWRLGNNVRRVASKISPRWDQYSTDIIQTRLSVLQYAERGNSSVRKFGTHDSSYAEDPSLRPDLNENISVSSVEPTKAESFSSKRKRTGSIQFRGLYKSLVFDEAAHAASKSWSNAIALQSNGEKIPDDINDRFKDRLWKAREAYHAEDAVRILHEIEQRGFLPSARAVKAAIESCVPAQELILAEQALEFLRGLEATHPAGDPQIVCSAKTMLAMSYCKQERHRDVIRVMGLPVTILGRHKRCNLSEALEPVALGRDSLAWGVLMKSLTKLGYAELAVDLMDLAVKRGVGMTDSLLHLTLESLRSLQRWKDADWLFTTAVEKGIKPSELTLASLLRALATRAARGGVELDRLQEISDMAEHPSPRLVTTCLMAFASHGAIDRAESLFHELGRNRRDGVPEEQAFGHLMSGFGNFVKIMPAEKTDLAGGQSYDEVNTKASRLWTLYMNHYRLQRPTGSTRSIRLSLLANYIRVKTLSFKNTEAIELLEEIAGNRGQYPWLELNMFHVSAVLGSLELSSDVNGMMRVLQVMKTARLKHDIRSLAFSVGTYVGDGALSEALTLVRSEIPGLLASDAVDHSYRKHHPILLLRRLRALDRGFKDAGFAKVNDLEAFINTLQERVTKSGSKGLT